MGGSLKNKPTLLEWSFLEAICQRMTEGQEKHPDQVFNFEEMSKRGAEGEFRVARYLENLGFIVKPHGQHNGMWPDGIEREYDAPDFFIEGHRSGAPSALAGRTMEVKSDSLGHETDRSVLEILSNVGTGRAGWVYSSRADFTAFLYTGNGKLLIVATEKLREALKKWQKGKVFSVANPLFTSLGLLVPTKALEEIAVHVGTVP